MEAVISRIDYFLEPGGSMTGTLQVPGDKSISHRSVMLGSIAEGITRVTGFLEGEDCLATIQAFRQMGVRIDGPIHGELSIHGVGLCGLMRPGAALDLGNSGTSMRLLIGLLAAQSFDSTLVGDDSLMRRPMKRVSQPLIKMGASIHVSSEGTPPVNIRPVAELHGIRYDMPVASAQVKSAIILAALYAKGVTQIIEPKCTRDHTERMLTYFGARLQSKDTLVEVTPGSALKAKDLIVPADLSSAAFFIVATCIGSESRVILKNVGINPTRTGVIDILRAMGGDIQVHSLPNAGGEPVADIEVSSSNLRGIEVPVDLVPSAIDEFPVICIAAACAQGATTIRQAAELRVKESDRIACVAQGLKELGIQVEEYDDGLTIQGGMLHGGKIDSAGDHRIAMAFAIAALRAQANIEVMNCANVATSFPGFAELARSAGLRLTIRGKE